MGAGWRLRGYIVDQRLGAGASGEVWRGRVAATKEPVALKRIAVEDAEHARRACAEAAKLAELDHPNVIGLHEMVSVRDAIVLVMQLGSGGSLADLLRARGRLTPGEVISAMCDVGAALTYAHARGIVHGDVSPGNVVFSDFGLPLLSDLGVARLLGDSAPAQTTAEYMDPAVAAGAMPLAPSDVFMLGAVALHALTGEPLWRGRTSQGAWAMAAEAWRQGAGHVRGASERLSAAGVSAAMSAVVLGALHVRPEDRITAADFALELRGSGEAAAIELAAGRVRRVQRRAPRHRRNAGTPAPADNLTAAAGRPSFERAYSRGPGRGDRPPVELGASVARQAGSSHTASPWAASQDAVAGPEPGREPLTMGVRLPPLSSRAVRATERRRSRRALYQRHGRLAAALGCALALVVAFVTREALASGHAPSRKGAARAGSATFVPSAVTRGRGSATAPTGPAAAPSMDSREAADVLDALDAGRAEAFRSGDAHGLEAVYLPGHLLDEDSALLRSTVPPGCSLVGARTRYEHVRVLASSAASTLVVADATLPPSTLQCPAHAQTRVQGAGPLRLCIELIRGANGYRIAHLQPA